MANLPLVTTAPDPAAKPSPKLRAALEYLGDKLVTHPASRFKPTKHSLLDEWLATRRRFLTRPSGNYRSWLTKSDLARLASE